MYFFPAKRTVYCIRLANIASEWKDFDMQVLFFIFPMKMKHAVWVLAGICCLAILSAPYGGVVYIAQLGGGLFGYLYMRNDWIRTRSLDKIFLWWQQKNAYKNRAKQKDLDQQIDQILDKISKLGIHTITKRERQILERRSKK